MNIQWYPGHMTKAKRQMQEDMKLIDLCIEIVDARCPLSSRNPDIDTLAKGKGRLLLLNKSDLSDPAQNKAWASYFNEKGIEVLEINARSGAGVKNIASQVKTICKDKLERDLRRGIKNSCIRAMVVGIPNVGKSTLINSISGRASTKTGNKPGVTKGKQWIHVSKELELLDTPGILWPKFEDEQIGMNLAYIGSVNDEILQLEELSFSFVAFLKDKYPQLIESRYGLSPEDETIDILNQIARKRGCLKKGDEVDYTKAAKVIFDDFRGGLVGKITLEFPGGR